MSKLKWDQVGERLYTTGVQDVALYVYDSSKSAYGNGVAWNGVETVTKSPDGAEATAVYANNHKYLNLISAESLGGTITAYMSPKEFDECDGEAEIAKGISVQQQARKTFALVYKTLIGNDTQGTEYGYKINIIYGATAQPSEVENTTVNDDPEAVELSWEFSTTPVDVEGHKPTASIEINSTDVDSKVLKAIEDKLYGSESSEPTLLMPAELITMGTSTTPGTV